LKVMHSPDPADAARFANEARLLLELDYAGIVRGIAHGTTDDGRPYLAMQWLEGETLATYLERQRLTVDEAMRFTRQVAEALAVLHRRGIVHRDVKPSNLFLVDGKLERVTLLDLGIARAAEATGGFTAPGAIVGTPAYMAPEQARAERSIDARADVFALGCILFKCLTGRTPFVGEDL